MRIYEELFIVDPKATEEQIDGVIGQIEEFVREAGGTIDKVDKWGIRKLAYRINKREEGYYVLVQFSAGAETIRELERRLRVEELVLKYLTVRIDEKLKWLEKRKKIREKRAARRPKPAPAPSRAAPAEPAAPVPGAPAPAEETEEKESSGGK